MRIKKQHERRLGGPIPYGQRAEWAEPPSEEEVNEILEMLTSDPEESNPEALVEEVPEEEDLEFPDL